MKQLDARFLVEPLTEYSNPFAPLRFLTRVHHSQFTFPHLISSPAVRVDFSTWITTDTIPLFSTVVRYTFPVFPRSTRAKCLHRSQQYFASFLENLGSVSPHHRQSVIRVSRLSLALVADSVIYPSHVWRLNERQLMAPLAHRPVLPVRFRNR